MDICSLGLSRVQSRFFWEQQLSFALSRQSIPDCAGGGDTAQSRPVSVREIDVSLLYFESSVE